MTWYYELDETNNRIRLYFKTDDGTIHGPRDVDWPDTPTLTTAADGWVVQPDVKAEAGRATTDFYTDANTLTALMALRDFASGDVKEGTPQGKG